MEHHLDQNAGDLGNQLLSVLLGQQEFAMNIMAIREIRGWINSTPLPHAPSYIKGMINLRGSVLPIVDVAERLGLATQAPSSASVVVVVEAEGSTVGLLVDAVCDIITIKDQVRQSMPETGGRESRRFIESLIMRDDRIISILSLKAVMPATEVLELEREAA
jgi:purine-binding chemotaxis protein CheW